ncbi:MAG TPA: endolytic transglycosylase MltG [Bacteroidales bacterium]|nr:endolytic transglycosylase MltG [Bacteroidales bacterium]
MGAYYRVGGSRRRRKNGFGLFVLIAFFIIFLSVALTTYVVFFRPNTYTAALPVAELTIPTGSDFDKVSEIIYGKGLVINRTTFKWASFWLQYHKKVRPGYYLVYPDMSNLELIRILRSGRQTPVKVTFNSLRDVYQLSERIAGQIEADSASIAGLLSDSAYISFLGYDIYTIPALFIPNTYEFYWTTSAEGFISRMFEEHKRFWNESRRTKAAQIPLSPLEVSILASIVEKETNKNDEKPIIAGVYINRLRYGWRLQADPTLVFATRDFEARRIADFHLNFNSPYNTYMYAGLPPGPICIPSISSIDAVLNFQKHRFFYFCARDDLSGYHAFAENYEQHQFNAWKYRRALDRLNIRR